MKFVAALALLVLVVLCAGCVSGPLNNSSASPSPTAQVMMNAVTTPTPASTQPANSLSMTAIDVGRGDALLLTFPNGKHVLVDSGGNYTAEQFVIPYLVEKNVTHLDAIVCTHEHWDHIDGLIAVLQDGRITVDRAYDSGFPITRDLEAANAHERASIDAYVGQLNEKHIKRTALAAGDTIDVGRYADSSKDTSVYVLSPNEELVKTLQKQTKDTKGSSNHAAINEGSLVLRIGYGKVHFLLAGDTSLPGATHADAAMLGDPVESSHLSADVLKLGHHGFSEPDDAFYQVVQPKYVIMTFGPQLRTDAPYCEGLHKGTQNFDYFKSALWSTCDKGTVVVTTDGTPSGIYVKAEGSAVPKGCCCNCVNDHPPRDGTPPDAAT